MAPREDRIRVHVRVRGGPPPGAKAAKKKGQVANKSISNATCVSVRRSGSVSDVSDAGVLSNMVAVGPHQFAFDTVFPAESGQEELFEAIGAPLAEGVLSGYNGTVLAYGQTGSGKTYTMQGVGAQRGSSARGLIPRALEYIWALMARHQETETDRTVFKCKASVLEIYGESVIDLNREPARNGEPVFCPLHEDNQHQVFAKGLTETSVRCADDALAVLLRGMSNRTVAETQANTESSRSHLVFTLEVQAITTNKLGNSAVRSTSAKLNLVDLAGSERQKNTETDGKELREACSINQSLAHLGRVVRALSTTNDRKHIPFRDSKLTYLLRSSLGGNSRTHLVANIAPEDNQFSETLSTLKFASNAKKISCQVMVNRNVGGSIEQLQAEVKRLEELLASVTSASSSSTESAEPGYSPDFVSDETAQTRISELENILSNTMQRSERERQVLDSKLRLLQESNATLHELAQARDDAMMNARMLVKLREAEITRLKGGIEQEICNGSPSISSFIHADTIAERERVIELHFAHEHMLGLLGAAIDGQPGADIYDQNGIDYDMVIAYLEQQEMERQQLERQLVELIAQRNALLEGRSLNVNESEAGSALQESQRDATVVHVSNLSSAANVDTLDVRPISDNIFDNGMIDELTARVAELQDQNHRLATKFHDSVVSKDVQQIAVSKRLVADELDFRRMSMPHQGTIDHVCSEACHKFKYNADVAESLRIEANLRSAQVKNKQLLTQVERLNLDLEAAREELETREAAAEHEQHRLREEITRLESQVDSIEEQKSLRAEAERRAANAEQALSESRAEIEKRAQMLTSLRDDGDTASKQIRELEETEHNLRNELSSLQEALHREAAATDAAKVELAEALMNLDNAALGEERLKEDLEAASVKLQEVREEKLVVQEELDALLESKAIEVQAAAKAVDNLKTEMSRMRVEHATIMSEHDDSFADLQRQHKSELHQLQTALADVQAELTTLRDEKARALSQVDVQNINSDDDDFTTLSEEGEEAVESDRDGNELNFDLPTKLAKLQNSTRRRLHTAAREKQAVIATSHVLESRLRDSEAEVAELQRERAHEAAVVQQLSSERTRLRSLVESYQERLAQHAAANTSSIQELQDAKQRVADLSTMIADKDEALASARAGAAAAAQRAAERLHKGLVLELGKVKAELEAARSEAARMAGLKNTQQRIQHFEKVTRQNFDLAQENSELRSEVELLKRQISEAKMTSSLHARPTEKQESQLPLDSENDDNFGTFAMPKKPSAIRVSRPTGAAGPALQPLTRPISVRSSKPTLSSVTRRFGSASNAGVADGASSARVQAPIKAVGGAARIDLTGANSDPFADFITSRR